MATVLFYIQSEYTNRQIYIHRVTFLMSYERKKKSKQNYKFINIYLQYLNNVPSGDPETIKTKFHR